MINEQQPAANRFAVVLLEARNRGTGKGTTIYTGDDANLAKQAANQEAAKPENVGKFIRFYDFNFFGGGMNDVEIKLP